MKLKATFLHNRSQLSQATTGQTFTWIHTLTNQRWSVVAIYGHQGTGEAVLHKRDGADPSHVPGYLIDWDEKTGEQRQRNHHHGTTEWSHLERTRMRARSWAIKSTAWKTALVEAFHFLSFDLTRTLLLPRETFALEFKRHHFNCRGGSVGLFLWK